MDMGLDLLQREVSKSFYADYCRNAWGLVARSKYSVEQAQGIREQMEEDCPKEWKEAERINDAYFHRVKRLKHRISDMLKSGDCLFLTFTFTNYILLTTNADTRRQKVRRYLSQYNCPYVANIDFGKKYGREHYHAIIQCDKVDFSLYNYGALNGQKITNQGDDIVRLAKYISKLTNHAIKKTTKQNYIIYSRNFFKQ